MFSTIVNLLGLVATVASTIVTAWAALHPSTPCQSQIGIHTQVNKKVTLINHQVFIIQNGPSEKSKASTFSPTTFSFCLILFGYYIQPYIDILFSVLIIASVSYAINVRWGTKRSYFPSSRRKYIVWSISPIFIMLTYWGSSYVINHANSTDLIENIGRTILAGTVSASVFSATVIFIFQQLLSSALPFLRNDRQWDCWIIKKAVAIVQIWWMPTTICFFTILFISFSTYSFV